MIGNMMIFALQLRELSNNLLIEPMIYDIKPVRIAYTDPSKKFHFTTFRSYLVSIHV